VVRLPASRRRSLLLVSLGVFLLISVVLAPVAIGMLGDWSGVAALSGSPWWFALLQLASLPSLAALVLMLALGVAVRKPAHVAATAAR
jgi:hypothetical protein